MTHETPGSGSAPSSGVSADQLTLYASRWCGYCARVMYAVEEMSLEITAKDVGSDGSAHNELVAGGGSRQVPCPRIERPDGSPEWMYESPDIVDYLRGHLG